MELSKTYDASQIEKKWYKIWEERGYFAPQKSENLQKQTGEIEKKDNDPFTILIPPPNVTGILHMGHVLNNTLQDIAIRYNRMAQRPTLWIPGTDHAGIATQNMVEKELAKQGLNKHDLGREKLIERIWDWKKEKGSHIIQQLKQLGASCDWSREVFTMDENLTIAVNEVFVHLYKKGLIYKGKYIINWCPRCVTALANDEVEHEDKKGKLWYIRYPIIDTKNSIYNSSKLIKKFDNNINSYLVIATTRPETMLGDVAVAINPKDERYTHLIGKHVLLPITNRIIPIIADDYVDKDFGTGCVKVTPAHDPNDFEIGLRHGLKQLVIMDEQGRIDFYLNEKGEFAESTTGQLADNETIEDLQGLDRFVARNKIIERLTSENLLDNVRDHENSVGHCYRCDTIIEPYLSDQWFVRMKPLAERAINVVETGEIKFYPERWTKVYMHWMHNIRDWCISRQIWWGHRIPAYYCQKCSEMTVSIEMPDKCGKCNGASFVQDEDVLDTWFSSWLWPFSTMGWPQSTADLKYFLPTNLLVTAPEIIYLWVARMIMATLEFQDKIPFKNVLLHGIVRDAQGRKMSKSLGNSPDPIDIINNVGADALRFSIIFNTPKGQDSYYSSEILETGRNFCNKIWNAFRFIMMSITDCDVNFSTDSPLKSHKIRSDNGDLADKWIYSRLNQVIDEVNQHYKNIRFNDAAQLLMMFIWDEFCSWYVEMAKEKLRTTKFDNAESISKDGCENVNTQKETCFVLLDIMQASMRLLHPIMPFISEEVWQKIKEIMPMEDEALIIAKFPETNEDLVDYKINNDMSLIKEIIVSIRNIRKQINIPPAVNIDIVLKLSNDSQKELFTIYKGYICKLAKVKNITMGNNIEKPSSAMVSVVQDIRIYFPLKGLIDIEAEKTKLLKQKEKLLMELSVIQGKLENEKFINFAKTEVIEKEKEKKIEIETKLNTVLDVLHDISYSVEES